MSKGAFAGRGPDAEERPGEGRWRKAVEAGGILAFFALAGLIGFEIYGAMQLFGFGYLWLVPPIAVAAYLLADLASGIVHFLFDNFWSPETPILGPNFVRPFREHHDDPDGLAENGFVGTNGNNSLAAAPVMLAFWLAAPVSTTVWGLLLGTAFLFFCLAVFLTNQLHKWAHTEEPARWVAWLQGRGVVLSREHHGYHHSAPYDTYYCITVGFWNPVLDRLRFFERAERAIRRVVPGTDPRLRSEREGNLNG